jgi:hypothetical protein
MKISESSTLSITLALGIGATGLSAGAFVSESMANDREAFRRLELHRETIQTLRDLGAEQVKATMENTHEIKALNETMKRLERKQ